AWSQRGAEADTQPRNAAMPSPVGDRPDLLAESISLGLDHVVYSLDGAVAWRHGDLRIVIAPLLSFESRSPDRCWTVFASGRDRIGPRRRLTAIQRTSDHVRLGFDDPEGNTFAEQVWLQEDKLFIEAFNALPVPVYSHLNTFAQVTMTGH